MMGSYLTQVNLSQMVQISSTTAKFITILETYNDFQDVFFTKNARHLPMYEDHDHAIDLVDNKQPPHGPISRLSENEPSIVQIYINKTRAN